MNGFGHQVTASKIEYLRLEIKKIFDKWESAAEEQRRRNEPLNDTVIAAIRKDIGNVFGTDL